MKTPDGRTVLVPNIVSGQTIMPRVVRSMFNARPEDIADTRFTHVECQVFPSPANSRAADMPAFIRTWEPVRQRLQRAAVTGKRVVALADDAFMFDYQREWMHKCPWAMDAVEYVARAVASTGIVDCVEMVDESKTPGEYRPEAFLSVWRAAGGPPVAWPTVAPSQWESAALSDHSDCYWPAWAFYPTLSVPDQMQMIAAVCSGRRKDRPFLCLSWCCNNVGARSIKAQVWLALAYGASGTRMYAYDWEEWERERAAGNPNAQTGSQPGDERWPFVVDTAASLAQYEHYLLLGTRFEPTRLGPWVFGRRGPLVWGVHTGSWSRKTRVYFWFLS